MKGEDIFREHDLTREERKTQERMGKWRREEREKGRVHKMEQGSVRIEGRWMTWEDVEREIERKGGVRIEGK